jgi:hypothetical protein
MLAKSAPFTPSEISRAVEEMSDDEVAEMMLPHGRPPAPPTAGGPTEPPRPPSIEEDERRRQPPRRKRYRYLDYYDEYINEDGIDWVERVAIAKPGRRIVGIRHRISRGRHGRFTVLTEPIHRNRKGNGNGGSNA